MGGRIVVNGNNVGFLSAPIPFYGHIEVQLIGQEELYLSCSGWHTLCFCCCVYICSANVVRIGGGGAPLGAIIPDGIRGRGLLRTILDHKLFAGGTSTFIQDKDSITLMSGSLGDMNLKTEIDSKLT